MSSVGVSAPLPQILPHSPRQKSTNFCFTPDSYFILFDFSRADFTAMQKHSHPFLFFSIPFWSFWRPLHSRRTDDLRYPDPHIPRFNRTHTFFSVHFSVFSPLNIWLATFVSIVPHLESVCTSFHIRSPPHPFYSAPPRFAIRSVLLALSWGWPFEQRLTDVIGFSWGSVSWPVSIWFIPLLRTSAVPFVRIVLVPPIL
jgi:hypothetical protein